MPPNSHTITDYNIPIPFCKNFILNCSVLLNNMQFIGINTLTAIYP